MRATEERAQILIFLNCLRQIARKSNLIVRTKSRYALPGQNLIHKLSFSRTHAELEIGIWTCRMLSDSGSRGSFYERIGKFVMSWAHFSYHCHLNEGYTTGRIGPCPYEPSEPTTSDPSCSVIYLRRRVQRRRLQKVNTATGKFCAFHYYWTFGGRKF